MEDIESNRIYTRIVRVWAHIESARHVEEDVFLCEMKDHVKRWFSRKSLASHNFAFVEQEVVRRYCERNGLCPFFSPITELPLFEERVTAEVHSPVQKKRLCPNCIIL